MECIWAKYDAIQQQMFTKRTPGITFSKNNIKHLLLT